MTRVDPVADKNSHEFYDENPLDPREGHIVTLRERTGGGSLQFGCLSDPTTDHFSSRGPLRE